MTTQLPVQDQKALAPSTSKISPATTTKTEVEPGRESLDNLPVSETTAEERVLVRGADGKFRLVAKSKLASLVASDQAAPLAGKVAANNLDSKSSAPLTSLTPELLRQVITDCQLQLETSDLEARLKQILTAYLKGVFSQSVAWQRLITPVLKRGVGLSQLKATEVLASVKSLTTNPSAAGVTQRQASKVVTKVKHLDLKSLDSKVVKSTAEVGAGLVSGGGASTGKTGGLSNQVELGAGGSPAVVPESSVVQKPGLVGPVEELAQLNLVDLRRYNLGGDKFAKKIRQKLAHLGQESFLKKREALDAWRSSPLNQLYVKIVRQAMVNDLSLDQIIEQQVGDSLTKSEFQILMDLNSSLN